MITKEIDSFMASLLLRNPKYSTYINRFYVLPKKINHVLNGLRSYKQSSVFLNKVTKKEAPDYHLIIKNPMDLGTIQKKILYYNNYEEFKSDLNLIWKNCYTYNAGPYYINCADTMKAAVESLEIEKLPVPMDKEFKGIRIYLEGKENTYYHVKHILSSVIASEIRQLGFKKVSKNVMDIFLNLVENEIVRIILKETYDENKFMDIDEFS